MTLIRCGGCGEKFTSIAAKERHRVDGRCLPLPEMLAAGLYRTGNGFFSDKKPKKPRSRVPYSRYSTRRAYPGPI